MPSHAFIRLVVCSFFLTCFAIQADTITLTFDVDVFDQFDYATMANDLQGFSTVLTVTFDNAVTLVEQDPTDTLVFFGHPAISSPLTAMLPYGPTPGQPPQSRDLALGNRDYGPSQEFSEFTIVQSQETVTGPATWTYSFDLDSGSQSPLIPDLLQNSSTDLHQQLLAFEKDQISFSFNEYAEQFDSQSGQALAGTAYRATASLVDIQETAEPTTFAMLAGVALLCLGFKCAG